MEKTFENIQSNERIGTLTIKTPGERIEFGFGGGSKTLDLSSTFNFQEKFLGNFSKFQDIPENSEGFTQLGCEIPHSNSYVIVQNDENNDNKLTRYVYSGENDEPYSKSNWTYQYSIYTPTRFTAEQQQAIDSGITENKLSDINANIGVHESRLDGFSTRLLGVEQQIVIDKN